MAELYSSLDGAYDHDISSDGSRVLEISAGSGAAYGSDTGYAIVYERDENGDYSPIGPQLNTEVYLGKMNDDGNRILLLRNNYHVTLYDFSNLQWSQIKQETSAKSCHAISGDGKTFVHATNNNSVVIHEEGDDGSWTSSTVTYAGEGFGNACELSHNGQVLSVMSRKTLDGNRYGTVQLYEKVGSTWNWFDQFIGNKDYAYNPSQSYGIHTMQLSEDGSTFALANTQDENVGVYEWTGSTYNKTPVQTVTIASNEVTGIGLSADANVLVISNFYHNPRGIAYVHHKNDDGLYVVKGGPLLGIDDNNDKGNNSFGNGINISTDGAYMSINDYGSYYTRRTVSIFNTCYDSGATAAPTLGPTLSSPPTMGPAMPSQTPSVLPTSTLPGLGSWYISNNGDITEEATSKDIITIKLPFNSTNRDIGAVALQKNCTTEFPQSGNYFVASTTPPTSSQPDGYVQFNTTLEVNITALNGTSHWNEYTDGTRGGWVEMCVETFLSFNDLVDLGNDDSNPKIIFKNNVLNISLSLTADYEIDNVNVERENATEANVDADYSDFITAYECTETDLYSVASKTYTQGEEITICVRDTGTDFVQVEEFVNLVVSQEETSEYNFILNRLYNPEVTTVTCTDNDSTATSDRRVCYAKIRALAQFFSIGTPPDLTISGSVDVRRDGRRVRRILRNVLPTPEKNNEEDAYYASSRRLQENGGSGGFEVNIGLTPGHDSASNSGLMSVVVGAAGLTGAVLML